jgi:hypothetical protein
MVIVAVIVAAATVALGFATVASPSIGGRSITICLALMFRTAAIHASTFRPVSGASMTGKGRLPASPQAVAVACGSASTRVQAGAKTPAILTAKVKTSTVVIQTKTINQSYRPISVLSKSTIPTEITNTGTIARVTCR